MKTVTRDARENHYGKFVARISYRTTSSRLYTHYEPVARDI
jgi:hypothetical protein